MYPWADQAFEKYQCLEKEGVPREYLSSYCIESSNYQKSLSLKTNEPYDISNLHRCLEEYGIDYQPNECSAYLLMPRG